MTVSSHAEVVSKERTFGWIVRRLLFYVGLALAALTVFALFFALIVRLGATKQVERWFDGGWIAFLAYTVLLFWITVRESRVRWRYWSFWLAIVCLLILHCLAFVIILHTYPKWRTIWFWPITVAEAGVFGGVLWWLLQEKRRRPKDRLL